ncbi:MAG: hypothetical protein L0206_21740, partial [Actinobacteria bacterium]|nr:hypothetical protein [Actinomycetota bacterium]
TDITNLEQFMLAFDSNLAPIVGQQITLTSTNAGVVGPRITLMIGRAAANECEVTVKGTVAGEARGSVRLTGGQFRSDRASEPLLTDAQVRAFATTPGQELTYTCAPPGSGTRMGIDRDEDGFFDRDEIDAGSDPADPGSVPGGGTTTTTTTTVITSTTTTTTLFSVTLIPTKKLVLKDRNTPPADPDRRRITFRAVTKHAAPANRIVPPAEGGPSDPRSVNSYVAVFNAAGLTSDHEAVSLDLGKWTLRAPGRYRYRGDDFSAIKRIDVGPDRITIKGGRGNWEYTLDEPAQGRIAVVLGMGEQTWCAEAPAKLSGSPPSTATNDRVDKFVSQSNAPAPASCPPTP